MCFIAAWPKQFQGNVAHGSRVALNRMRSACVTQSLNAIELVGWLVRLVFPNALQVRHDLPNWPNRTRRARVDRQYRFCATVAYVWFVSSDQKQSRFVTGHSAVRGQMSFYFTDKHVPPVSATSTYKMGLSTHNLLSSCCKLAPRSNDTDSRKETVQEVGWRSSIANDG